jgi:hypothetical protein
VLPVLSDFKGPPLPVAIPVHAKLKTIWLLITLHLAQKLTINRNMTKENIKHKHSVNF